MLRFTLICSGLAAFGSLAIAADRSAGEVYRFRKGDLCPVTQNIRGACAGYQVDHIEPLCAGGADHRANMQWLTVAEHRAKTRADARRCRLLRQPKKVLP
jgi:hypothetical protein